MERREAPGDLRGPLRAALAIGPPRAPITGTGLRDLPPGARASCGRFARPAARALRLPALHPQTSLRHWRKLECPARIVDTPLPAPPARVLEMTPADEPGYGEYKYAGSLRRFRQCRREKVAGAGANGRHQAGTLTIILSSPGLSRRSRLGKRSRARLTGMAGTSPAMTRAESGMTIGRRNSGRGCIGRWR